MELDSDGNAGAGRQLIALVFDGALRVADVPRPASRDEALIRVRLAGICNTDLEIMRGYKGFRGVLGHEFVGEVVESADSALIGKRVCGEINIGCGDCRRCQTGMPGHCSRRTVLGIIGRDGAFAEYLRLPERNLHLVPDFVSDETAVFVEPLAAAFQILEQASVAPEDRVIILGDGKLGLLCAQVLARTGARVEIAGHHEERRAPVSRFDISWMQPEDVAPGADMVIEATGSPSGLGHALSLVRPGGTIVLKSTVAVPGSIGLNAVVVNEVRIIGSRCGPFPQAISALENGEVDVAWMIESRHALRDGVEAMHQAEQRGTLKVLLDPRSR
jgi:threonine dehydrogenase-like Zn-dependent dehydrogenase